MTYAILQRAAGMDWYARPVMVVKGGVKGSVKGSAFRKLLKWMQLLRVLRM